MAAAEARLGNLESRFAAGEFGPLLDWLRREIHGAGRMLESEPLVERATGTPVSADWLAESLRSRYGPAHGLD
jgi:carboxypeptidase Taq